MTLISTGPKLMSVTYEYNPEKNKFYFLASLRPLLAMPCRPVFFVLARLTLKFFED